MFDVFASEEIMFVVIVVILLVDLLLFIISALIDGLDGPRKHKFVAAAFILFSDFVMLVLGILYGNHPPIGALYVLVVMGVISALFSLHVIITASGLLGHPKSDSDDDSGWIW